MSWTKPKSSGSFKVNFVSLPNELERLIVVALEIRIRAAIMGRSEKLSATNQAKMTIFKSWGDDEYRAEINKIESDFSMKKVRCMEREGSLSTEKYNSAVDEYSDMIFQAIWNLLDRIGKSPQKSEETWDD